MITKTQGFAHPVVKQLKKIYFSKTAMLKVCDKAKMILVLNVLAINSHDQEVLCNYAHF